jgi:hypothetical protein
MNPSQNPPKISLPAAKPDWCTGRQFRFVMYLLVHFVAKTDQLALPGQAFRAWEEI